ncbi:response regulator [Propylenella binzhouense]|uniref:Response regulator n=1 Tax=Propylenella binzhouense TaxID=2555902 RepID=A0A964WU88_9HYPH|nr:response regulator [Propylenella binzhouense]MYZ48784.1 response regulator [Propylenella binzhouense]
MLAKPEAELAGLRIMIVEDEYFIADDLAAAVRRAGGTILGPVPSLSEARSLLSGSDPVDAAVLDLNLRDEMAYPIAELLRLRGIPFVFATGYDLGSIPPEFQDVPHWEKPFDHRSLVHALSRMLGAGGGAAPQPAD